MSRDLRIRAIRGVVAPDALGLDPVHATRPPPAIPLADFFAACQQVEAVETTDDDAVAWMTRNEHQVAVRWSNGQIYFDEAPRWVLRIAIELSKHVLGTVQDTLGAKYIGPMGTRYPDVLSVLPEQDLKGNRTSPDFSETHLRIGWSPLGIRGRLLMRLAQTDPDLRVVLRSQEPWVTWSGHPSGQEVVAVVRDETLQVLRPDLATARWMVSLAKRLGSICCDKHGLIWVADDGPDGVAPMWPEPHPVSKTTIHALLERRAHAALDQEAKTDTQEKEEVFESAAHDGTWWQRMLSQAVE